MSIVTKDIQPVLEQCLGMVDLKAQTFHISDDKMEQLARLSNYRIMPDCTYLVRTIWPEISLYLLPFFLPVEQGRTEMGWELHERLKNNPEDTFCLFAYKHNLQIISGFIIAYKENDSVWIWQARAMPGFKYSRLVFNELMKWSKMIGAKRLEASISDSRKLKFYKRKYGFEIDSNKIICNISEKEETETVNVSY